MRTPPGDLGVAEVQDALGRSWGLTGVELAYAPVGFGSHHWIASVRGRPRWFVTADRWRPGLATAFEVAADLRDEARLPFVVAPVRAVDDEVVAGCGAGYLVAVTPYLDGARDWPAFDTAVHRTAVIELAASLHRAQVTTAPWADDFAIEARDTLTDALDRVDTPWDGGIYAEGLRGRLRAAAPRVRVALARYDALVDRVRARAAPGVVTHGELKPGNLLLTPDGPALVDWDTTLLAPPERDLWRLVDADPAADERYAALTGHDPDPDTLELYRRRWDLTDIALDVEDLLRAPARTADTDLAWRVLRDLLAGI